MKPQIKLHKCSICGTPFVPRPKTTGTYCSYTCSRRGAWRNRSDAMEHNARISRATVAMRAAKQRGTGKKGYIKWFGRHQHRIVAEKMLGRKLRHGEIVHHIDGNGHNNDPRNLVVITQRQHMLEHGLGVPGITPKHKPWKYRRRGDDDPNAKLTSAEILEIRRLADEGEMRQKDIGARFGIKQPYVSQIAKRRRWKHI